MTGRRARRITRELAAGERARVQQLREPIAAELPDLVGRDPLRHEAREEATLSGELRRAIHASPMPFTAIAAQAGISFFFSVFSKAETP